MQCLTQSISDMPRYNAFSNLDPAVAQMIESKSYSCSCCGKTEWINQYAKPSMLPDAMSEKQLCYECCYWEKICEETKRSRVLVHNGICYIAKSTRMRPLSYLSMYQGRHFYAVMYRTHTLVDTNHLIRVGKVPPQFKDRLPDNALFISLLSYKKLRADTFVCRAKGCYDRYRCLRYNSETEGTPFNKIPEDYEIGSEKCPSFVDKLQQKYAIRTIKTDVRPTISGGKRKGILATFPDADDTQCFNTDWLHL